MENKGNEGNKKRKIHEINSTTITTNQNSFDYEDKDDDDDDDDDSDFDPDAVENTNTTSKTKRTQNKKVKLRRGIVYNSEINNENNVNNLDVDFDIIEGIGNEDNDKTKEPIFKSKNREVIISKAESAYDELMTIDRTHYSKQITSVSSRQGCEIFAIIGGEKADDLKENPWTKKKGKKMESKSKSKKTSEKSNNTKNPKEKKQKRFELLSSIFGETRASRVIGKPSPAKKTNVLSSNKTTQLSSSKTKLDINTREDNDENSKIPPTKANISNPLPKFKAPTKIQISETYKYAGKEVVIEREVDANSQFAQEHQKKQKKTGLDKLLDDIKGPQNLSTVGKSNMDWKDYKKEKGLDEELEIAAKDGYISKQEFLQRVDHRQFEQERDDRLREQAKRQNL